MKKKNIPGIHHYCDKWCERCAFSDRCAVFENEKELTPAEQDMRNQAFWERLKENFAKARMILEDAAKSQGLDLNIMEADLEEVERKSEEKRKLAQQHIISRLTNEYATTAAQWLKTQPGMLDKLEMLKIELGAGVEETSAARHQIETIKDSLAVIQWYSNFIHSKFIEALISKSDESFPPLEDLQRDFHGSAKVAILSTERSMQAWKSLFELLPEQEDHFLNVLSLLERISKEALNVFPEAMSFIRPGFDEPSA
jgi:hypothetical protein